MLTVYRVVLYIFRYVIIAHNFYKISNFLYCLFIRNFDMTELVIRIWDALSPWKRNKPERFPLVFVLSTYFDVPCFFHAQMG